MSIKRSKKANKKPEITFCLIGDTGVGKSSFGNLILDDEIFAASESPDPVTLEAVAKSKEFPDIKKWVIDTEGLNDGNSINSIQIKNLALLLKNYKRGVNVISIVLNGRHPRFSQGVKDIIQFTYNAFATKELMSHICIVFTNCDNPKYPNRQLKKTEFMNKVRKYLSEISGMSIDKVPVIPCFFVDCYSDGQNQETNDNMDQFNSWSLLKKPLDTKDFKEAGYREVHEIERRKHHFIRSTTRGKTTYEIYEDQERTKIIPNNKDSPRYTDWICTKRYEEAVKKKIVQRKNDVYIGHKYSKDGTIRYRVTVDQERIIIRDLRKNKRISSTGWYNISKKHLEEDGRIINEIQTRNRKFETKSVQHHGGHGFFGGSNHTHVTLFHRVFSEQRTATTDFEGKTSYSNWLIVPGSDRTYEVGRWEEGGHTPGYSREIN